MMKKETKKFSKLTKDQKALLKSIKNIENEVAQPIPKEFENLSDLQCDALIRLLWLSEEILGFIENLEDELGFTKEVLTDASTFFSKGISSLKSLILYKNSDLITQNHASS